MIKIILFSELFTFELYRVSLYKASDGDFIQCHDGKHVVFYML